MNLQRGAEALETFSHLADDLSAEDKFLLPAEFDLLDVLATFPEQNQLPVFCTERSAAMEEERHQDLYPSLVCEELVAEMAEA